MEELLTCSVCCERYCEVERQPVLLPRCGHSFCRPCVTLLLTGGCIICPTCRTDQRIESAHRLPTEYTLLAIIAAQENAKLDNCPRHDVKLSFWCKTCGLATCGECLFEDHPTHSHDVIRSLKYIQNIKESVQDVACKFMEALDNREQSYYKAVYTYARRIDDALRNVTVLRKDMGEARNLMKGIKVDETSMTISTATSLAEAAKYLGLKWNIQDANFNRTQNEEKDRDKAATDVSEDKDKDKDNEKKERKERKRLKKLLAEKEAKKESAEAPELTTTEITPEPTTAPVVESEPPKDVRKKSTLRKSKTLSVFEPFSMDKEITDIKEKLVELDNKDRERIEMEGLKRIEEEEQEENDKKILDLKKVEAEQAAEVALAAVETISQAKEEELNKILDKEAKEAKKKAEELKAAEEELERLNQILKKPRGRLARKYLAEKEKEKNEVESTKLDSESKDSVKTADASDDKKSESSDSDEGKEKTNGGPEHSDKDKDDEEPKAEGSEVDPYLGELSLEDKQAQEAAGLQQKGEEGSKLLEFMQDPLFTICVEGSEGRLALMQWERRGLHVYCHQFQQLHYDIAIKSTVLQAMIPSKNPIVFLELTVGCRTPRRIYIKLWGHMRRAHNFMALCIGDLGSAFLNTKLLQIYNLNEPGERILGGDHEYNCGRGGCALLDDLEWNGDYCQPMKEGLLTAAGSGQNATNSLFLVCTNSDLTRNFSCPFGEIIDGLEDMRDAIHRSAADEKEVWITECGVVLEPPRV